MGGPGSGRHSIEDVATCWDLQQSGYYNECRCERYHSQELFERLGFDSDTEDDGWDEEDEED